MSITLLIPCYCFSLSSVVLAYLHERGGESCFPLLFTGSLFVGVVGETTTVARTVPWHHSHYTHTAARVDCGRKRSCSVFFVRVLCDVYLLAIGVSYGETKRIAYSLVIKIVY